MSHPFVYNPKGFNIKSKFMTHNQGKIPSMKKNKVEGRVQLKPKKKTDIKLDKKTSVKVGQKHSANTTSHCASLKIKKSKSAVKIDVAAPKLMKSESLEKNESLETVPNQECLKENNNKIKRSEIVDYFYMIMSFAIILFFGMYLVAFETTEERFRDNPNRVNADVEIFACSTCINSENPWFVEMTNSD